MYSNAISSALAYDALRTAVESRARCAWESPLGITQATLLAVLDGYVLVRTDELVSERWPVSEVVLAIKSDLLHLGDDLL